MERCGQAPHEEQLIEALLADLNL